MPNDINSLDTLFPYDIDKEDAEYMQKAAKIIFHTRNFNAMDGVPQASEIYASDGEKLFRDIMNKGIDDEDMFYLKTCFDTMKNQERNCLACKILKWRAPSTTSEETPTIPTISEETISGLTTSEVTLSRPNTSQYTIIRPTTTEETIIRPTATEETNTRPITIEETITRPTISEKTETTHTSTTLDDILSGLNRTHYMISGPITSEYTITRPTTSEFTITRLTASECTPTLPITPEYTVSQPTSSECTISRPATSKYATNSPTKSEYTITRPATSEETIIGRTKVKGNISNHRPPTLDDIISRLDNSEEYFARYNHIFNQGCWFHRLNWIPHPTTSEDTTNSKSQSKRKIKKTSHSPERKRGCARTEGYLKNDQSFPVVKKNKKEINTTGHSSLNERVFARTEGFLKNNQLLPVVTKTNNNEKIKSKEISTVQLYRKKYKGKKLTVSKDTWNEQRRRSTTCQISGSNLFSFNHLKFLNSKLKLEQSDIHGLGVFASEPIGPNEIIIEYVGEVIRPIIADLREKVYKQSFCFTIDDQTVVDASKFGNISRFINHSCQPNSYAKLLVFNNQKKIVIYAKRDISAGEEITYDYKMKSEDDKIECLCKARGCKKSLN